jgi:assimilatory nitrate reductase electron transfer subunit
MTRLVVVGNGMVGARFVEDLLAADTAERFEITVLGAEPCEPYNRVLLSEVVSGAYELGALTLATPTCERLTIHRGVQAVLIDRDDRVVVTDNGARFRYDQLVLATGSAARIPPLRGLCGSTDEDPQRLPPGVHALRTIDDAREIVAATLNAHRAVVLGAGVLGLEAACGLARRGVAVTVVHPASVVMERQLDPQASRVVEDAMVGLGIDHRVGIGADSVRLDRGRLAAVMLANGETLEAQLLVLATGTTPAVGLARQAGLATARGIVVGADLASPTDRRVFAIGDCAQPPEGGSGLVAQGWDQARRLAASLAGAGGGFKVTRDAPNDVVRLKAHGLDVVTMGICGSQRPDDPAQRTLRLSDPEIGRHVEVVVSGRRLVGATCVGAGSVAADLVAAYTRRTPLPADPAYLLLPALAAQTAAPTDPLDLPPEATVCRCNSVTKAEITQCVHEGAQSLADVAQATRATTGCGGCADDVCALVNALGTSHGPRADGENRFTRGKHMTTTAEMGAL